MQFLRILFVIDELPVVLGGWRCWRVERPQNSVLNRRFSCGFGRVDPLVVRRWHLERPRNSVRNRQTSLRLSAGDGAGAWIVLGVLFGIDDLFVVFGGWTLLWFPAGGGAGAWSVLPCHKPGNILVLCASNHSVGECVGKRHVLQI